MSDDSLFNEWLVTQESAMYRMKQDDGNYEANGQITIHMSVNCQRPDPGW